MKLFKSLIKWLPKRTREQKHQQKQKDIDKLFKLKKITY